MNPSRYRRYADALARLERQGERRTLPEVSQRCGATVRFRGRALVNLSSNDYLGLGSREPLLAEYFAPSSWEGLDARGMASSASRLLTGNHPAYGLLEQELSDLYRGRAVCVFSSGYHAGLGICSALAGRQDIVLSDRWNHACLIDGMRLSGAEVVRYRHADWGHLEDLLKQRAAGGRGLFIVSESVFSMDGDVADLERLVWLRNRYDALLIVDEAHAVGVFGENGGGIGEARGLVSDIDVLVGTCGKSLASLGAFAVTAPVLKDYLVNRMRPLIFTTGLPPAVVNWTRTTLRKMRDMGAERARLAETAEMLRRHLRQAGAVVRGDSQIIPVILGQNAAAMQLAARLQGEGFLVFPIRPPTVPPGTARLRLSLTADLTWDRIQRVPRIVEEFVHPLRDTSSSAGGEARGPT